MFRRILILSLFVYFGNVMLPPKRPGPKQNLVAKVNNFYQTAKDLAKKVTICFTAVLISL